MNEYFSCLNLNQVLKITSYKKLINKIWTKHVITRMNKIFYQEGVERGNTADCYDGGPCGKAGH